MIRFLSYTASAVSKGKHKPILLIMAVALVGGVGYGLFGKKAESTTSPVASVEQPSVDQETVERASGSLSRVQSKSPDNLAEEQGQAKTSAPATTPQAAPRSAAASPTQPPAARTIQLSATTITLSADSSQALLTAKATNGTYEWTIASDAPEPRLHITREQPRSNAATDSAQFRFTLTEPELATPGTYQYVVTAKDPATGGATSSATITATITITITAPAR